MADHGLIRLRAGGLNIRVRGSVTESGSSTSAEAIVHTDGSVDRSFTRRGYEISLETASTDAAGNPLDLDALMAAPPGDIVLVDDASRRITNYFRAVMTGEPNIDRMTGAVTLTYRAEARQVTNA